MSTAIVRVSPLASSPSQRARLIAGDDKIRHPYDVFVNALGITERSQEQQHVPIYS